MELQTPSSNVSDKVKSLCFIRTHESCNIDFVEVAKKIDGMTAERAELAWDVHNSLVNLRILRLDQLTQLVKDQPNLYELFFGTYSVLIINKTGFSLQFVLAYKTYAGGVYVEQTASLILNGKETIFELLFAKCGEVKEYAFSMWDADGNEFARSPTFVVHDVNAQETKIGAYKQCSDIIEVKPHAGP
jgi:hypothetical protein